MKEKIKSCWFICLFLVPKFYIVVAEDKYCEAIEKLQYGDIVTSKQPPYTVGTILTYKCDRGYRIQGKHIVTCLEDRKWSDPAPYCIALSCKRDLSMIEAERKCRKPCQKDADCKGGNKRCVCDDWCGKSCFNPSAPCPALLHPENGYIIGKEFSYGKTVTYGCDQGFVLTGPTTRKCRSNRKWSGHVPKCIALSTCGQTEQKEKSMLYGKVILGTEVQIGAWPWQILLFTNKKHHTTQIYDPNSGFGGGSIINNKWILSAAHVFYERFPMGFFKKDWKKRFLIAVGMTKHPMPGEVIPDRINIFEPQHLHAHAKFDGSSYDYDIALIRIGNRLKVVGNKFVVDSQASSGSLTFTRYIRPVCLPCMKGHPFSPVNILERYDTNLCSRNIRGNNPNIPVRAGDETMVTGFGWKRSSGFVHWDKPKVMQEGRLKVQKDEKCINSVKLMQKEDKSARYTDRMICAKSADKSKNIDACEGDSGGPLVKRFGIQHSRYWMQVGIVSWGWGCGNEHPGFYTSLSSVMDWVWSVLNKTKTDSCSKPSAYEHSSSIARKEVYRVGEVITFSCNQGYAMSGNPDITCQSDLTWSLPQFLCTVINCGQPHIPRNGYIKGESYLSGDWVEYYCDQGFRFTVSNATYRRRCMSSGVWSGESINCESEVLCSLPSIISGTIKGSEPFKVGSIVFFVCNDGYKISGNSLLTCSENGLWNPPPPKCTIDVNCDFDKSDRKLCAYTNEGDVEWKRDFESDSRLGLPKIPQWTKNCPDGYKELVDSCYRQYSGPKNYEKAKKICENDGGHLANVQSKRVNEFLWENTWGSSAHYWIGLRNVDSNMLWSNGEKFERGHGIDFDLSGATSNNCGKYYYRYQAWVTKAWQIRFDDCSEKTRFICEKWKDNVNNYVVETSKDNYLPKIEGVYKPVSGLLTFEEKRQIYRKENDFDMYLFYEYHSGLNKRNWFIGGYSIPLGKPSHQYEVRTYSNVIEPDGIKTQWKDSYGRSIDITIEKHDMWQEWSEWECDVICGPGKKVRTRSCKNGAAGSRDCKGETWQEDVCNSDCGTSQVHNKKDLELDHNGIMYLFKTDKVSWDVAKMNCANVGSILAKSTGRDVQRKLGEKILQILNVDGIATNYWINGIYDTNTWRFQDGTVIPRDQRLWNKHEPNRDGTGRDCVEISPTGWNDKGCAIRRRYICQKESMKKGPCYPDPCNDRGNCRVGIDGDFICHCRPPFSGKSCERGDEFSIE
uniref:uncharacterized protein LOC120345027 isoform X5 n=1 Tax=Styela clava TaxID=7725 RepID=UPI001939EF49|nr:uncharacterized protein LOC120345027 isoform X5 [Styela clava]